MSMNVIVFGQPLLLRNLDTSRLSFELDDDLPPRACELEPPPASAADSSTPPTRLRDMSHFPFSISVRVTDSSMSSSWVN